MIPSGATHMRRKEGIVAGAALALVLYTLVLSVLGPVVSAVMRNRTVSNAGSVKAVGVGVYWDQACTSPVASIDWGFLEPASNKSVTVYVRNEGNVVASLAISASAWNPASASNYMTLSWDYAGQTLSVSEIFEVTFTLSVSATVEGVTSFSFDILITATGE